MVSLEHPMKKTRTLAGLWATLMLAGLAACGGGGSASSGTLRVALTDAPTCGYDEVNSP
jgi:ABC-type glycerol-3-phosphate transport system substrate-binding protein